MSVQARALDDMMGGKLEVEAGTSFLDSEVPRPAWLDDVRACARRGGVERCELGCGVN